MRVGFVPTLEFAKIGPVLIAQVCMAQQVGTALPGSAQSLLPSPPHDLGVMA